jgi:hypothetical protein
VNRPQSVGVSNRFGSCERRGCLFLPSDGVCVYRSGGHPACRRAGHPARRNWRVISADTSALAPRVRAARCRPLRQPRWPPLRSGTTVNTYRTGAGQGEGRFVGNTPTIRHLFLREPQGAVPEAGAPVAPRASWLSRFFRWHTGDFPQKYFGSSPTYPCANSFRKIDAGISAGAEMKTAVK